VEERERETARRFPVRGNGRARTSRRGRGRSDVHGARRWRGTETKERGHGWAPLVSERERRDGGAWLMGLSGPVRFRFSFFSFFLFFYSIKNINKYIFK
jgi:hypothetical protein